jgi:hypothetical protein
VNPFLMNYMRAFALQDNTLTKMGYRPMDHLFSYQEKFDQLKIRHFMDYPTEIIALVNAWIASTNIYKNEKYKMSDLLDELDQLYLDYDSDKIRLDDNLKRKEISLRAAVSYR